MIIDNATITNLESTNLQPELKQALLNLLYPIGIILEFGQDMDPNSKFIGQTWEEYGAGRVTIAAGSYTDKNGTVGSYTIGEEENGEYQHTLTVSEMPSHRHSKSTHNEPSSGQYAGKWCQGSSSASGWTDYTDYTGGSQAHHNIQPYIVVKRWIRTA